MGLNSRALLLCVFLLGMLRFITQDLSEEEFYRDYTWQIRVAHNATAENMFLLTAGVKYHAAFL